MTYVMVYKSSDREYRHHEFYKLGQHPPLREGDQVIFTLGDDDRNKLVDDARAKAREMGIPELKGLMK